jgi:hypothetical protein
MDMSGLRDVEGNPPVSLSVREAFEIRLSCGIVW